jgi:hypothetical protein
MQSNFATLRQQDTSAPVTLVLNEESVRVDFVNYNGKTVSQLFAEYGRSLIADASRIKEYALNNTIVPGETQVRPGETVRAILKSEQKG